MLSGFELYPRWVPLNFIDLDSELVDLNYKVASLIFCHFWRSILPINFDLLLRPSLYAPTEIIVETESV